MKTPVLPIKMRSKSVAEKYYYGTGKRKTSIAKVRLYPSKASQDGGQLINDKPLSELFSLQSWKALILEPLAVTEQLESFSVVAQVYGGGVVGQAGAIRLGISKALVLAKPELKKVLRDHGLLTRDSRIKESKKYGLKRARRAPQYTKR
jgi:small subunit ribosomal protein S9